MPGSSTITITDAGTYAVYFYVSGIQTNQFSITLNSVPGIIYGSGAPANINYGQAIITVDANSLLTIRNHSSSVGAVTLSTLSGGLQPNVNASVIIIKIA